MNKLEKIRHLFDVTGATVLRGKQLDQYFVQYMYYMYSESEWLEIVRRVKEKVEEAAVAAYDACYSEAEMDTILAYAESPVGQKTLEKAPEIGRAVFDAVMNAFNEEANRIRERWDEGAMSLLTKKPSRFMS